VRKRSGVQRTVHKLVPVMVGMDIRERRETFPILSGGEEAVQDGENCKVGTGTSIFFPARQEEPDVPRKKKKGLKKKKKKKKKKITEEGGSPSSTLGKQKLPRRIVHVNGVTQHKERSKPQKNLDQREKKSHGRGEERCVGNMTGIKDREQDEPMELGPARSSPKKKTTVPPQERKKLLEP